MIGMGPAAEFLSTSTLQYCCIHTYIHTLSEMRLMELCALSIGPIELVVDHLFLNLFPLFSPIKNGVIYCDINHINKAD